MSLMYFLTVRRLNQFLKTFNSKKRTETSYRFLTHHISNGSNNNESIGEHKDEIELSNKQGDEKGIHLKIPTPKNRSNSITFIENHSIRSHIKSNLITKSPQNLSITSNVKSNMITKSFQNLSITPNIKSNSAS
jgi:hypothetical protein